jgi:poly(3-hydroxybutyrate) depolymerase
MKRLVLAAVCVVIFPSAALAQALTPISSLRVSYNTRKTAAKPTGALKAQIDELDQQIAAATRLGRGGEVRRLYAKGQALLAGQEWTEALEFANSITLRSARVLADSTTPYEVRLEQIYAPAIVLERPLTAHAMLRKRPTPAPAGRQAPPPDVIKDFGTTTGVARDMRETPQIFDLDVAGVANGDYQVAIEVSDNARLLGTATLNVHFTRGLDAVVAGLEADAAKAPEKLRADILFPVERMRHVNRGRLELRTFDPDRDFADAQKTAAAAKAGTDPFATKTGDFKRHYVLESASEIMPYRMYVPTTYDRTRAYPLIIALHGVTRTEDWFFDSNDRAFAPLAERHGYIVASPFGYRTDGGYGWGVDNPPADADTRQRQERSEADVMRVLALVRQTYQIDDSRIYLVGHSMGAGGTWKIAAKYPDIWAAVAPIAGSGDPATLDRLKHVPAIVVHGDADNTVNVEGSRRMVARAKTLGMTVEYIEVAGGTHDGVVGPNYGAIFDFLNRHRKQGRPAPTP